jgi:hypothetical protein
MNKTAATRLAKQSRQYGYHQENYRTVYVFCPLCRDRVNAELNYQETVTRGIDRVMIVHGIEEH